MIWLTAITVVSFILAVAFGVLEARQSWYADKPYFIGVIVFGLVTFIAGLILLIVGVSRTYGRTACANWGKQVGAPTKFVLLNTLDTGKCFAKTPRGQWVLNSKWQAFVGANRGRP